MAITRKELFKALGAIQDGPVLIDSYTEKAYTDEEIRRWKEEPYQTTSFHCSSYPGSEINCRCYGLYKLLNIPEDKPISAKGIGVMEAGKAVEEQIVERWYKSGILLGGYPEQIYVEDEDTWLTGKIDALLNLLPEYKYVLPVEIKTKKNNVIEYMRVGGQDYDEKHYNQLQSYIAWCRKNHETMGWDKLGLLPAQGGIIYYVSREDPRNTHEFYVNLDEDLIKKAEEQLKLWQEAFLNDELPPRPKEWRWTLEPCKWNPYKRYCKQDYKDGITKLSESAAVKFALEHDSSYNIEKVKERIKERWQQKQLTLF